MTADARLARFERATELPLLLLAIAMVPLLLVPLAWDLGSRVEDVILALDWLIWGVFASEFSIRVFLARGARLRYIAHHWIDVLIVILPFMRPLRVLRSARALLFIVRGLWTLRAISRRRGVRTSVALAAAGPVAAAAVVFYAERGAGGTIQSFDDALWWALATITTVGYGDVAPVTHAGRGVATFLMLLGIGLFGVLTASVASWFVEQEQRERADVAEVMAELRAIRRELGEGAVAGEDSPPDHREARALADTEGPPR